MINEKEDDVKFIENQVKFMYGKYYEDIINNAPFSLKNNHNTITINECFQFTYNHNNQDALIYRLSGFISVLKKYWNKDIDNYIFKTDWNDNRDYNEFIITYNRKYNSKDNIMFPLLDYHFPEYIKIEDNIPFLSKQNNIIWRGSTTGSSSLQENIRYNIVVNNINKNKHIDLGFSHMCQDVYYDNVNAFDNMYKGQISRKEQLNHKFILNIEGNDCASSFAWVLSSNCCPLHNYPFTWETYIFGSGLEPYIHFIPIEKDGSDLIEKYDWCMNNLDKCEEIANNGKKYIEKYLRIDLYDRIMQKFFNLYPKTYIEE